MKKLLIYFMTFWVVGIMISLNAQALEVHESIPELYIKAVNPGYRINGVNNVGELIEISRKNSDEPISLAGIAVGYTNSSGNDSVLVEFPENSFMTGETILLRLASSPGYELASLNYKKTLAMKAGLTLRQGEEIIDTVCWNNKEGCYKEFKSSDLTTLVRNLETGEFEYVKDYEPDYDSKSYYLEQTREEEPERASQCAGLQFSEILSYYETDKTEQFIELYNPKAEQILLDGCQIRYKNKNYALSGVIKPEQYLVYYPRDFSLTKNPVNANTLDIIDVNGGTVDTLSYPNGQRKGTSYAWLGHDERGKEIWRVTYAPTPGAPNNYQEYKTCEEGKVINKVTGNCVKKTTLQEKVCKEGQYLNLLTGRCKKIETSKDKTCKEGYYLNPETNRCRKIQENKGAGYSVEPESYEENSSFVALYAVIGVASVGVIYLIYEFRHELSKLFGKVYRRFRR